MSRDVFKSDWRQGLSGCAIAAECKGDIDIDLSERATRGSRQPLNSAGTLFTNIALTSAFGAFNILSRSLLSLT